MGKEEKYIWKDRRHILWFPIGFDKYWIENGRLYCRHGMISQKEHECLLYRILDISLSRSFGNRICGTGSIVLRTTDASDPIITLKNIKDSRAVKTMLSDLIEEERVRKGITSRELLSAGGGLQDVDGDGDIDIDDYL